LKISGSKEWLYLYMKIPVYNIYISGSLRILNILGKKHRVWGAREIWIRHVNDVRGIIQM
jgi:hypothetical protein